MTFPLFLLLCVAFLNLPNKGTLIAVDCLFSETCRPLLTAQRANRHLFLQILSKSQAAQGHVSAKDTNPFLPKQIVLSGPATIFDNTP